MESILFIKRKLIFFLYLILAAGFFSPATAYSSPDYYCKINRVVMTASTPELVFRAEEKRSLGEGFTVERDTGLIIGVVKNSYITKPIVIDKAHSRQNSYKVMSALRPDEGWGPGSNIYALTVNEYEETEDKSFVFLSNDRVYLGTCRHVF